MGFLARFLIAATSLGFAVLLQNYRHFSRSLTAPQLNVTEYWGPGSADNYKEDTAVKPFQIKVNPEVKQTTDPAVTNRNSLYIVGI